MSPSKTRDLERRLKKAEQKVVFLERISQLETEVKLAQTEKISQLELKLKESVQANAESTTKMAALEQQLQQTKQSKRSLKTSFISVQAKFTAVNEQLGKANSKIANNVIDADSWTNMIKVLHILGGKNERIMVRYEGKLDIRGWHISKEFKPRHGKTFSDFESFWNARQAQRTFDHLLKMEYHEGTLKYVIHDANEEISKLREEHPSMATRVGHMYLDVIEWSLKRGTLLLVPWNYHSNTKATKVEILDFLLELVSTLKRVRR